MYLMEEVNKIQQHVCDLDIQSSPCNACCTYNFSGSTTWRAVCMSGEYCARVQYCDENALSTFATRLR